MLPPRRLIVVVQTVSERAVGQRRQHGGRPSTEAENRTISRAARLAYDLDHTLDRRLHSAGGEHHPQRVEDAFLGRLTRDRGHVFVAGIGGILSEVPSDIQRFVSNGGAWSLHVQS
ncbi:hypothetical protein D3C80_941620 [compost metagenome]